VDRISSITFETPVRVEDPGADSIVALRSYAFDRLSACAAVIDGHGEVLDTNEAWRLFAYLNGGSAGGTGPGVNYLSICDRAASDGVTEAADVSLGLREILAGNRTHFDLEYPCPSPIEDRWFLLSASSAPIDAGAGAVIFHVDTTARKLMNARLVALAETDSLTGLPNRGVAIRLIEEHLARASGGPVTVLFVDVNDFKDVNDRYGHHAGDELLAKVAARTTRTVREHDRLCRFGGDEFVLVCPNLAAGPASILAERLRTVMAEPFQLGADEVTSGVSVGIATSRGDSTVDSLLQAADAAMYVDKRRPDHRRDVLAGLRLATAGVVLPRFELGSERALGLRTDVADAVIVTDLHDFRIQSFNCAAEALYGWSNDEVIGRPLNQVNPWISNEGERLAADRQLYTEGRWHGELSVRRRDGTAIVLLGSTTLVRDDSGTPVGAVFVNRPGPSGAKPSRGSSLDSVVSAQIRRGTTNSEFIVHYQPVVRLADNAVVGVEALARWQHPERGLLSPDEFIEAAERSGDIIELGQSVLRAACAQTQAWRAAGRDLNLAVNLSSVQLLDDHLPDRLAETLAATGLPADQLWLEITETTLVHDLDRATRGLHRIRDLGVSISIDDFGTGWASLTYLRQFPVNALKIDRLFVTGIGLRTRDTAIAQSIISLADELGIGVVAEGIETIEQAEALQQMGCKFGQGFLFGRPQPASHPPRSRRIPKRRKVRGDRDVP
jgi:diguanylate cyclase (GGDEF)-like protein/PAS domain S-box-containing protein